MNRVINRLPSPATLSRAEPATMRAVAGRRKIIDVCEPGGSTVGTSSLSGDGLRTIGEEQQMMDNAECVRAIHTNCYRAVSSATASKLHSAWRADGSQAVSGQLDPLAHHDASHLGTATRHTMSPIGIAVPPGNRANVSFTQDPQVIIA